MDTQEQPTEEAVDRRDLLLQQFEEAETPPEESVPVETQEPEDPEPEEPKIWAKPPSSWKKDYHDAWDTVDPKVREYIWQREDETRAGIEPLKSKAQFAEQVQKVAEPYMQTIQSLGVDLPTAVGALMDADHNLRYGSPHQKRGIPQPIGAAIWRQPWRRGRFLTRNAGRSIYFTTSARVVWTQE
jgi:hypothetical protein